MQHDDASGIAVLLDNSKRNAFALRALSEIGPEFQALSGPGREPLVRRYCVKNIELGSAAASNAERPVKGITTCLCEINRTQDLLDRCHTTTLHASRRCRFRCRSFFGVPRSTPSVHGGASLAGNESARTSSISRWSIRAFRGSLSSWFFAARS